jgi:hypothetical protein
LALSGMRDVEANVNVEAKVFAVILPIIKINYNYNQIKMIWTTIEDRIKLDFFISTSSAILYREK